MSETNDQRIYDRCIIRVGQLEAENEELRELLTELYEEQCDECDRWKYRDRMRELGIEVDG